MTKTPGRRRVPKKLKTIAKYPHRVTTPLTDESYSDLARKCREQAEIDGHECCMADMVRLMIKVYKPGPYNGNGGG